MPKKIFEKPDFKDYNIQSEYDKLCHFLASKNMAPPENILEQIKSGDIIEIYSYPENIQIYSNSEFRKICSYSIEQMTTIPFTQLFWRDDKIHNDIIKQSNLACSDQNLSARSWNIDNHEIIESLHPRKRTFEMSMGLVCPCIDKSTKAVSCFISTVTVNFIFEWADDIL